MSNPNQGDSYKERIPQDTRINEDFHYKERPSMPWNGCQPYATIKTPKNLTNQGAYNFTPTLAL